MRGLALKNDFFIDFVWFCECKLWNHLKVVMWILDILFYFLGFVIKIEKPSIKNSMNSTLSFISNFGVVMLLNFDMVLMSRLGCVCVWLGFVCVCVRLGFVCVWCVCMWWGWWDHKHECMSNGSKFGHSIRILWPQRLEAYCIWVHVQWKLSYIFFFLSFC